jgi:hypothetical protein
VPPSLSRLKKNTKINSSELAGRDRQRVTSPSFILLKVLLVLMGRLHKLPLASSHLAAFLTAESFHYQLLTKMVKMPGNGMVIVSKSISLPPSPQVTHSGDSERFMMVTTMMLDAIHTSPFMPTMNMTGQDMDMQTGSHSTITMARGMTFN